MLGKGRLDMRKKGTSSLILGAVFVISMPCFAVHAEEKQTDKNFKTSVLQSEEDPELARLRKNAEEGDAQAQYDLGDCYASGECPANEKDVSKKDLKGIIHGEDMRTVPFGEMKAAEWWQKSAAQGNMKAQYSLAVLYHSGRGVPFDYEKAFALFKAAADQGDGQSMYNVAQAYEIGEGTAENDEKAVEYYLKAIEKNVAGASVNLRALYKRHPELHH
ncbi:sel1 repeat family protein [Acetobacteraceae bacterium]|nr:sel1 repeat family protein [Acetobacteraceae bacterium]